MATSQRACGTPSVCQVTPVLLEAGVPYILLMGRDLVYQVLLGSDPVAVHKLLLMFSR